MPRTQVQGTRGSSSAGQRPVVYSHVPRLRFFAMSKVHPCRWRLLALLSAALILMCGPLRAQGSTCRPVSPHAISPADEAYKNGSYPQAEQLYMQQLAQQPQDAGVSASLIETFLREDKVAQAAEQVKAAMAANPQSAALLTAEADVQFRQGEPWLAMKT